MNRKFCFSFTSAIGAHKKETYDKNEVNMLLSRNHVFVNVGFCKQTLKYSHYSNMSISVVLDAMKSMVTESFELIIQVRSNLGDLEQVV